VAIIMDGNGRWAEARGLPRIQGHEAGVESVRAVTRHAAKLGLDQLTLYAFSTENWKRPGTEIEFLMALLEHYVVAERDELMENGIRLGSIGRIGSLPEGVVTSLRETEALTKDNDRLNLVLALSYGGRTELVDAARRLARDQATGAIDVEALDDEGLEKALEARMYQPSMPPLDLMVRTAGEMRLSNFLLWQTAYAELYVTDVHWPDFREDHLEAALAAFGTRQRRFGGLVEKGGR
jgi:undecaprenyl diphosphate synthase